MKLEPVSKKDIAQACGNEICVRALAESVPRNASGARELFALACEKGHKTSCAR